MYYEGAISFGKILPLFAEMLKEDFFRASHRHIHSEPEDQSRYEGQSLSQTSLLILEDDTPKP